MKVVTATSQTQGWRDNDFCWTVEGELLFFAPLEVAVARPRSTATTAVIRARTKPRTP